MSALEPVKLPADDGTPPPFTPWQMAEAQQVLTAVYWPMNREGYLVALYGSVSRVGHGNDLDLLLVPWRLGTDAPTAMEVLANVLNGQRLGVPYEGEMDTYAQRILLPEHKLLDVQIRGHTSAHRTWRRDR